MKYIKLFEEHNYSVYDLITMGANQVFDLLKTEMTKGNPDLELIKDILAYTVVDINRKLHRDWTVLMWTAYLGKSKLVEMFLNHPQIDVNLQDIFGWTALMLAVRGEDERTIELLLGHPEINIPLKDKGGYTAWGYANDPIRQKFPKLNPDAL
jgi:ankyrin repeat protein